ncbi:MAG: hypothetical protein KDD36_11245 [Flavobacteriales bacterium]|nr:hypothetical protein [Flavobacteriales bacterium]
MKNSVAIFGGIGIGALLGLLMGMSVSGTVAVVVGALTSALLVLLGLKEQTDPVHQALRVGAFGVSCTVMALVGLYIRANSIFSPTVEEDIRMWTQDSSYTIDDARQFVAYQRLGILPKNHEVDKDMKPDPKAGTSVLFSKYVSQEKCDEADGYVSYSVEEQINAWKVMGGVWAVAAKGVTDINPNDRKKALALIQSCLCHE